MQPTTLAVDLGSTHFKACLFSGVKGCSPVQTIPVETNVKGAAVELDPVQLNSALKKLLWKFRGKLRTVDRIIFANQSPSLTVMGKNGSLLHPIITHLDRRSAEEAKLLCDGLGREKWLSQAGNLPYPGGIAATSILWLKRHRPAVFKQAHSFGCLNTYLGRLWAGQTAIDPANASFMGLFHTTSLKGWNREFCDYLELKDYQLPEIKDSSDVVGELDPAIARQFGFRNGIPIHVGTIDTSAAAFAQALEPGDLLHISGTSDVLATPLLDAKPSEKYLLRGVGVGNRWLAVRTIPAGGATLKWCEKVFQVSNPKELFLAEKEVSAVQFDPYLGGDRLSVEPKSANFRGLTLGTTRNQMLGSVMLALKAQSLESLDTLKDIAGLTGRVIATGNNQTFARWLHRTWKANHNLKWKFRYEPDLGLRGLVRLALGEIV